MKKVSSALAAGLLVLSGFGLAGCGGGDGATKADQTTPEGAVTMFIEAMKDGDAAKLCQVMDPDIVKLAEISGQKCEEAMKDMTKDAGKEFENVKVGTANVDGDTATVKVSVKDEEESIPTKRVDDKWYVSFGDL